MVIPVANSTRTLEYRSSPPVVSSVQLKEKPRRIGAIGGKREWKDSNLQPPVSGRGNGHAVPIFVSFFPLQGEDEATSGAAGNRSPGQVGWRARRILAIFSFRQSGARQRRSQA